MDRLSVMGILLGCGGILFGQYLEGGNLASLVNIPAAFIVLGGTCGAVMLQSPLPVFLHAFHITPWVFWAPSGPHQGLVEKIVKWSTVARKEGLLGLEDIIDVESDLFLKKGLQLLVDGAEPTVVRTVLEIEVDAREERDLRAARIFESMGGYSPTIGIIGAVMGLIHVLSNLADPHTLGPGIATAFVATIYGVGCANLLFLPIANKLKATVYAQSAMRQMAVEGLTGIAEGSNPRSIEIKLMGYIG